MSGYVRAEKFDEEFQGERVTGSLLPLSFPDLLRLQTSEVSTDEEAAQVLAELVPRYVKDFAGPLASDGTPVTIDEVCGAAYFAELAMTLGRKLVTAARPPQKPSAPSAS